MTLKELKLLLENVDPSLEDYQVEGVSDIVQSGDQLGRMSFPIDHVLVSPDDKSISLLGTEDKGKWDQLVASMVIN